MTALPLLAGLARAGIIFTVHDGRLIVEGPKARLTDDLRAKITSRKAELLAWLSGQWTSKAVALLAGVADDEARQDLAYRFDERAGICQYDGNMSRDDAERAAYDEIAAAMADEAIGKAIAR